jgi:hypothetical protein
VRSMATSAAVTLPKCPKISSKCAEFTLRVSLLTCNLPVSGRRSGDLDRRLRL